MGRRGDKGEGSGVDEGERMGRKEWVRMGSKEWVRMGSKVWMGEGERMGRKELGRITLVAVHSESWVRSPVLDGIYWGLCWTVVSSCVITVIHYWVVLLSIRYFSV